MLLAIKQYYYSCTSSSSSSSTACITRLWNLFIMYLSCWLARLVTLTPNDPPCPAYTRRHWDALFTSTRWITHAPHSPPIYTHYSSIIYSTSHPFSTLFLATLVVHIPFIYGTRITPISSVNPCEPFLLIIYHTYCDPIYSDPIHSDSMHSDPISPLLFSGWCSLLFLVVDYKLFKLYPTFPTL